jgi:hypothetical protein
MSEVEMMRMQFNLNQLIAKCIVEIGDSLVESFR